MKRACAFFAISTICGLAGLWLGGTLAWRAIPNPAIDEVVDFDERDRMIREMHVNVPRRDPYLIVGMAIGLAVGVAVWLAVRFVRFVRVVKANASSHVPATDLGTVPVATVLRPERRLWPWLQNELSTMPITGWIALVGLCVIEYRVLAVTVNYFK